MANNIVIKPVWNKPTLEELVIKCNPEDSPKAINFRNLVRRELI